MGVLELTTPDRSSRLGHASLISLMNMVMREADIHEIEDLLRREPTVAFKLLRYINSAGFVRKTEIASFRHAVLTVGMKRLFRRTAVLVAGTPARSVAPAAATLAIVRGRLMELLALKTLSPAEADLAFLAGMFSMLDLLLGTPLADALALVNLPASVSAAVLRTTARSRVIWASPRGARVRTRQRWRSCRRATASRSRG